MHQNRHKFLFLMDPYPSLNLETETSLALMAELISRGQKVFWLEDSSLSLRADNVWGEVSTVLSISPFRLGTKHALCLDHFDALLVRKDPPFDQQYLHLTLILDHLPTSLMQFNSVSALRNFNEKLLPLRWPDLSPPSLVTANKDEILLFLREHERIVLKPLGDCSGRGIQKLEFSESSGADIENYLNQSSSPSSSDPTSLRSAPFVMAQQFLSEVHQGDKRIFVANGQALGWVNRVPQKGQFLANIHQGAICKSTALSAKEVQAIENIRGFLIKEGIFFAGLDFIGGYLTEINITSPSAVLQINQAMNEQLEVKLVDIMLQALEENER